LGHAFLRRLKTPARQGGVGRRELLRACRKIPNSTLNVRTRPGLSVAGESIRLLKEMCHNVHMKTISIRELHLKTGQWVRHVASRGPIVVTDRGRRVAALQPFDASVTGRPLPNREAAIRKRSKVPVDSAVYVSELREDR
jgi:prevent-host-death family protein